MRIFFHCPSVKRRYKLPLQLFPVLREPSDLKTPLVDSEGFVAGVYRWKKKITKTVLSSNRCGGEYQVCIWVKN